MFLNLDRLESTERADDVDQDWTFDGLGNWSVFDDDGDTQTRASNAANETTAASGWVSPQYDAAGNMITMPMSSAENGHYHLYYDAWNRLVAVYDCHEEYAVLTFEYNGQNRRIRKSVWEEGDEKSVRICYYNTQWQCLEEQNLLGLANEQYIWGVGYIDDLVLRDHNTDTDPEMEQRLYALQDANYNVTALIEPDGDVAERYLYDAYGNVTILDPGFTLDANNTSDYTWTYLYTGRQLDTEPSVPIMVETLPPW